MTTRLLNALGSGIQERHMTYDAANRPVLETDAEGAISSRDYDQVGNLIREIDRRGTMREHDYDVRNRRVATKLRLERGRQEPTVATRAWAYDKVSNVASETLPNDNVITHVYDPLDRLTESRDTLVRW